ncbi:hypothetical protein D9758_014171 [Tetrapyrgos nigripes]|uniref:Uncharacterized protein n=1 Tax=Tetrapyrgos nigripes TaxID=182062 RepID=A0A8H5CLZ2_9AGAR|nr:hypothetical protein D9758_014171 [Tetrapyrgos nigripes]
MNQLQRVFELAMLRNGVEKQKETARRSLHVHPWRIPYMDSAEILKEFGTFIYGFTWEDPEVDLKFLDLTDSDTMFVVTSAGDNALHYAIAASPRTIHCVDMNPCQGHLLELKLACIHSLSYSDFFSLFGLGYHPNFLDLLETKIAPHLSSGAYQFWRSNIDAFTSSSFYLHGYSGFAVKTCKFLFRMMGLRKDIEQMCECDTLEDQQCIWQNRVRPTLLSPFAVALLRNPTFCWNALGVPMNQRKMLLDEGGVYEYVKDTMDPMISTYLLKTQNYFYRVVFRGQYSPSCCPEYLTLAGFCSLKANNGKLLDNFRIHTDSITNVLHGMSSNSITRSLIMDHLDWFSEGSEEVEKEISELHRVLAPGGLVFWRSAAKNPWYASVFQRAGFLVEPVGVRGSEKPLDRVNMNQPKGVTETTWNSPKMCKFFPEGVRPCFSQALSLDSAAYINARELDGIFNFDVDPGPHEDSGLGDFLRPKCVQGNSIVANTSSCHVRGITPHVHYMHRSQRRFCYEETFTSISGLSWRELTEVVHRLACVAAFFTTINQLAEEVMKHAGSMASLLVIALETFRRRNYRLFVGFKLETYGRHQSHSSFTSPELFAYSMSTFTH